MPGKPWTPKEDARLRELAPSCSALKIGEDLARSRDAVQHRARTLKISLTKRGDSHPDTKYSDQLIEQARQLHEQGFGPKWIAKRLQINERTLKSALYYQGRRGALPLP